MREKIAAIQHGIWAHWMEYLFSVSIYNEDGSVLIPSGKVARWAEQMKTHYFWLSEEEKESDRHQADKVLAVLCNNSLHPTAAASGDNPQVVGGG